MKKFGGFVLCLGLMGCALNPSNRPVVIKDAADQATITIQVSAYEQAWIEEKCVEFQKMHPNWDLTYQVKNQDVESVLNQEDVPLADVYEFSDGQLGMLDEAGLAGELGGDTAEQLRNSFAPMVLNEVMIDSGIYGIPVHASVEVLYYNQTQFTQKDVSSMEKLLKKGRVGLALDDEQFANCLGDEAFVNGLRENQNVYVLGENESVSSLLENVDAFIGTSDDYHLASGVFGQDLAFATIPSFTDGETAYTLTPSVSVLAFGVNPSCEKPHIVVTFAGYLGQEAAQKSFFEKTGLLPANMDVKLKKNDAWDAFCMMTGA